MCVPAAGGACTVCWSRLSGREGGEGRGAERSYVLAPHPGSSRLSVSQAGHQLVLPAKETQTLTRRGEREREKEGRERERGVGRAVGVASQGDTNTDTAGREREREREREKEGREREGGRPGSWCCQPGRHKH